MFSSTKLVLCVKVIELRDVKVNITGRSLAEKDEMSNKKS